MKDKIVLITGGAGTFGQAFAEEILKLNPQSVRIFDNSEYFLVEMQRALKDPRLRFQLGDVRDRDRLRRAMYNVDIMVHAAALKHVDLCEYNPIEAVKTNIDGTVNVIDTAIDCGVDKVLLIGSDKAVHPINIYGATKLVAEKLFTNATMYGKTKFSCVRYGNFWGSRGSVIPLWLKQREKGVITLTEKDMTRFWITLDEATSFAITCLERMKGGEIFIPIMPTHTLEEIASNIAPECKIRLIGRRKGEKKNEALVAEGEEKCLTRLDDMLIIKVL